MASAAEQLAANLNFSAFAKAEELKKRIWFTLGALLVYRLGTFIPLPGIDPVAFAQTFQQNSTGILGMVTLFVATKPEFGYLSSSLVKQVAGLGGNVDELVPEPVAKALRGS